jgi:hypothetical protein
VTESYSNREIGAKYVLGHVVIKAFTVLYNIGSHGYLKVSKPLL